MPFACFKKLHFSPAACYLYFAKKKKKVAKLMLISLFKYITSLRKNRPNASEHFEMFSGYSSGSPVLTATADPHIHRSHG